MQRVQPNKSFGQHFLKDSSVIERIVDLISQNHVCDKLIEIGPGTGALTSALIPKFIDTLTCIEVDERCVFYLEQNYPVLKHKIIHQDFLLVNLATLLQPAATIVGNFPYNISSQIIFKIIENRMLIPSMIGMFQKEVADRIASPPGNKTYGILSVLAQVYYDVAVSFQIPPSAFNPPPKVNSAVLLMNRKGQPLAVDYLALKKVVKAAFNQRRKMLRNSLKELIPESMVDHPIFMKRPEQLSVSDFVSLTNLIETAR